MQTEELIGRLAKFKVGAKLRFMVRIKEVRKVYGRQEVLVTPTDGEGEQWSTMAAVELTERLP